MTALLVLVNDVSGINTLPLLLKKVSMNMPSFPTRSWSTSSKSSLETKSSSCNGAGFHRIIREHENVSGTKAITEKQRPPSPLVPQVELRTLPWFVLLRHRMAKMWQRCMKEVWGNSHLLCNQRKLQRLR